MATLVRQLPIERVVAAAQKYALEHGVTNRAVPLTEFTTGGYLAPRDLAPLGNRQVFVYPQVRDDMPGMFILQINVRHGLSVAALSDGSIQAFSQERLDEHTKITGQQVARANGD